MSRSAILYLSLLLRQGIVQAAMGAAGRETIYSASACYGTHKNFLEVGCPLHMKVEILSILNGVKPNTENCPLPTDENNYRPSCCVYAEDDCTIISRSAFPTECLNVNNCKPRATWADTSKECNDIIYARQTHYMNITYKCVRENELMTSTTTVSTTPLQTQKIELMTFTTSSVNFTLWSNLATTIKTSPTSLNSTLSLNEAASQMNLHAPDNEETTADATTPIVKKSQLVLQENTQQDSFTPAMIGGMFAGTVGLALTILIFLLYWGRKRKIRVIGKTQPTVWDFLLNNTMSIRAFRGYDNFGSARSSVSSEESGSPVIRKNVWLPNIPNISEDAGNGESAVTSDDNCSVFTIERDNSNDTSNRL